MTPPHEQDCSCDFAYAGGHEPACPNSQGRDAELASLRAELQRMQDERAFNQTSLDLAVKRYQTAEADLQRMTEELQKMTRAYEVANAYAERLSERLDTKEAALRHVTEERQRISDFLDENGVGPNEDVIRRLKLLIHDVAALCAEPNLSAERKRAEEAEVALRDLRQQLQKLVETWKADAKMLREMETGKPTHQREHVALIILQHVQRISTLLGSGSGQQVDR